MKGLREDFDRWLVTASFEEKIALATMVLLGMSYLTMMCAAVASAMGGGRGD